MGTGKLLGQPAQMLVVICMQWARIPSKRSSNTPSQLHDTETGISSSSVEEMILMYKNAQK